MQKDERKEKLLKEVDELETMYGELLTRLHNLGDFATSGHQKDVGRLLTHSLNDDISLFSNAFKGELRLLKLRMRRALKR